MFIIPNMLQSKEKFFTNPVVVAMGAIICCLLWGSAFPCVKIGYRLFSVDTTHVPSVILFAGMRFLFAGILVLTFATISQKKLPLPKKENAWYIVVLAIFQTILQYILFYIGLANTTGVKSSVINGLGVFLTILSACFVFRTEKFNLIKLCGCLLGFGAVILINLGGNFSFTFSLIGEGFILLSGISAALAAGFTKIFSRKESTAMLCGWQFTLGGSTLIIIGLCLGGKVQATGLESYAMLFYLAIISSVAFTLQGYLMKYNPISKVAVYKCTNPLFGAVFSAIILHEGKQLLSPWTIVAVIMVCLGIFIINKYGNRGIKFVKKSKN